eukprot:c8997_g1_i1.p1 GENE.c8997_g1_i1~~c8997_g1_i1.p1  ORF type:complete len:542 (-),score=178.95 c8997_g1_i1:29-1624(-)
MIEKELRAVGENVKKAEREILKEIRNLTLTIEHHNMTNIPIRQIPKLSQLEADRWNTSTPKMKTFAEVVADKTPRWIQKLGRKIDRITRIPRAIHFHSMVKHARQRENLLDKFKPHFDKEVFDQVKPIKEHPVRFIYWVSVVQVIIFIISLFIGEGLSTFGTGTDIVTHSVPTLNGRKMNIQVSVLRNLWFGPQTGDLILTGAKYTPCMRKEPSFTNTRKSIVDYETKNYGCCVDSFKKCGQTTKQFCTSVSSTWTASNCSSLIDADICDEIILRPCCYYIYNNCTVATEALCNVLPGPRFFHKNAERCSDVYCESTVCGMGSLGGPNPDQPLQWWRFFTPIFAHVGVIHLITNLAGQIALGGDVEALCGFRTTATIYFACGIGGNMFAALMDPFTVSAGSSSSIYGLISVQTVDLLQSWPLVENKPLQAVRLFLTTVLLLGIGTLPWIDNFAHFGGYVIGIVSGLSFLPYISFSHTDHVIKWLLSMQSRILLAVIFAGVVVLFYILDQQDFCPNCKYINCVPYTPDLCGY